MHVAIAGPSQYLPNAAVVARAQEIAAAQGGSVLITTDASLDSKSLDQALRAATRSNPQQSYQLEGGY